MKQVILNHFGFSRLPFGKDIGAEAVWNSPELMDTKLAPYSMGEGTYGRDTK